MRELADRSGLTEAAITDIELGRRKRGVTVDELMVLAYALTTAPESLLPPLSDYIADPEQRELYEKVLAEMTTRLTMARDRQSKIAREFEEVTREVEQLRSILNSARQGRIHH